MTDGPELGLTLVLGRLMGCCTRPARYLYSTSKSSPDHIESPGPRGRGLDTVTAEANINTEQTCADWRSNLGRSLRSHVKVEIQYSGFLPRALQLRLSGRSS